MRLRLARLVAVATGVLVVALAVAFAWLRAQAEPESAARERGVAVYAAQGCAACHSIDGEGNRRAPLDGVGRRWTADEIRTWIVAPQQMDPQVRKRAYDQLSKADLDALVAYMQSLM